MTGTASFDQGSAKSVMQLNNNSNKAAVQIS